MKYLDVGDVKQIIELCKSGSDAQHHHRIGGVFDIARLFLSITNPEAVGTTDDWLNDCIAANCRDRPEDLDEGEVEAVWNEGDVFEVTRDIARSQ